MPSAISDIVPFRKYMKANATNAPKATGSTFIGINEKLLNDRHSTISMIINEMPTVMNRSRFITLELPKLRTGAP